MLLASSFTKCWFACTCIMSIYSQPMLVFAITYIMEFCGMENSNVVVSLSCYFVNKNSNLFQILLFFVEI